MSDDHKAPDAATHISAASEERFDVIHVHEPYAPILSDFALVVADCPKVATFPAAGEKAAVGQSAHLVIS